MTTGRIIAIVILLIIVLSVVGALAWFRPNLATLGKSEHMGCVECMSPKRKYNNMWLLKSIFK